MPNVKIDWLYFDTRKRVQELVPTCDFELWVLGFSCKKPLGVTAFGVPQNVPADALRVFVIEPLAKSFLTKPTCPAFNVIKWELAYLKKLCKERGLDPWEIRSSEPDDEV